MGLYLCAFDGDEELDGIDVGSYDDFRFFRDAITEHLETGHVGTKFPTLLLHPDSDGEWTVAQCASLERELNTIATAFVKMPPVPFNSAWQSEVAKSKGKVASNLYDCFVDVDGSPLVDRLWRLCHLAIERGQPILFQ